MNRPTTTLFMLMSLDGKISTGDTKEMDVDRDFPSIDGVKEGLKQYYEIEKTTDLYSLNTGKVFAKIGLNEGLSFKESVPAFFVVVDSKPYLTKVGIQNLLDKSKGVFLVTSNKDHPALEIDDKNLRTLVYEKQIDFGDVFEKLKEFGAESVTIQSGGTLNAELVRRGLVDFVSIVIAPVMVGGKDTPTIMDGESLHKQEELSKLKPLELLSCEQLKDSYMHLKYKVINSNHSR